MDRGKSSVFRPAFFAVAVAIATTPLFSQMFYRCVVGKITHRSDRTLIGAVVTLTNVATGERHQTLSRAGGDYEFPNLVPGVYRVDAEQAGFKKTTRGNVEVTVSGTVRADISMDRREVTQSVEVQSGASGDAITGKNISAAGDSQIGAGMANEGATYYESFIGRSQ